MLLGKVVQDRENRCRCCSGGVEVFILDGGIDNFTDMVADETVTTDCEELLNWLTEKGHPVLGLEPLM